MSKGISEGLLKAIAGSPAGIADLALLSSLRLCNADTLKTTLSRLHKSGRIIRLKRGVYAATPLKDAFAAAQATFGGYLGFTTALYLHKLIAEMPFSITVVTPATSAKKTFGTYEFRAVALGEKAVGFERKGGYTVSTRAKTLFDCACVPEYSVEENKLVDAFRHAKLGAGEWREFDAYTRKFAGQKTAARLRRLREILSGG